MPRYTDTSSSIWLSRLPSAYAKLLRDGYARQVASATAQLTAAAADGLLNEGVDPAREAVALYFLIQGLIGPVLIGQLTPDQAVELLDHQLNRIFRSS
jgi:BetI-type transcriptional repressor, C-terminal